MAGFGDLLDVTYKDARPAGSWGLSWDGCAPAVTPLGNNKALCTWLQANMSSDAAIPATLQAIVIDASGTNPVVLGSATYQLPAPDWNGVTYNGGQNALLMPNGDVACLFAVHCGVDPDVAGPVTLDEGTHESTYQSTPLCACVHLSGNTPSFTWVKRYGKTQEGLAGDFANLMWDSIGGNLVMYHERGGSAGTGQLIRIHPTTGAWIERSLVAPVAGGIAAHNEGNQVVILSDQWDGSAYVSKYVKATLTPLAIEGVIRDMPTFAGFTIHPTANTYTVRDGASALMVGWMKDPASTADKFVRIFRFHLDASGDPVITNLYSPESDLYYGSEARSFFSLNNAFWQDGGFYGSTEVMAVIPHGDGNVSMLDVGWLGWYDQYPTHMDGLQFLYKLPEYDGAKTYGVGPPAAWYSAPDTGNWPNYIEHTDGEGYWATQFVSAAQVGSGKVLVFMTGVDSCTDEATNGVNRSYITLVDTTAGGASQPVQIWNGSEWKTLAQVWNGTSWEPLTVWDGENWQTLDLP